VTNHDPPRRRTRTPPHSTRAIHPSIHPCVRSRASSSSSSSLRLASSRRANLPRENLARKMIAHPHPRRTSHAGVYIAQYDVFASRVSLRLWCIAHAVKV
jgi:hypothetical protein